MTQQVMMWKCGATGRVFDSEEAATRSEFISKFKNASKSLPGQGNLAGYDDALDKIAKEIASGIHPTAWRSLRDALDYFAAHEGIITGRSP